MGNPKCFNCGNEEEISNLFDYHVCDGCKMKLGLFQDKTIIKHHNTYANLKNIDSDRPTYLDEVERN